MNKEVIEKLALIYVEKNLVAGDGPEKAVELYMKADQEIRKASGNRFNPESLL